jgi:hypothetical protein
VQNGSLQETRWSKSDIGRKKGITISGNCLNSSWMGALTWSELSCCTTEHFLKCGRKMRQVYEGCWLPFNRWKLTGNTRLGHFVLPMAARQANCSYLPDLSFFRYFILADGEPARDNRPSAGVTGISGQVKVLFSHLVSTQSSNLTLNVRPSIFLCKMAHFNTPSGSSFARKRVNTCPFYSFRL